MPVLFELPIQLGGDPGDFVEYAALCVELAKLNHPACPEVDWAQVERLCLTLFRENGADLQTAAFYVLACGHRFGLSGLAQSLMLIESMIRRWSDVWPHQSVSRLAILDGLFAQLPALLRRLEIGAVDVPALTDLHIVLDQLNRHLLCRVGTSPSALGALCRHVARINAQVEPEQRPRVGNLLLASPQSEARRYTESMTVLPVLPVIKRKKRRMSAWALSAANLIVILMGGFVAWKGYEAGRSTVAAPAPVQLDSLSLFDAGSAALRSDSTRALVEALVSIKAKPGWLIVISGHSDGTGAATQNLQLSRDRAMAVKAWMQSMGDFPDRCFAVQGLGGGQPVATNLAESGRAANRRVDIRLMPQSESCHAPINGTPG